MKQQDPRKRDLIARIQSFHKDQDQKLVQQKYQALRSNAFAFFRVTCFLFYADWPVGSSLNQAPIVWVCGDLHLENFGGYKSDARKIYFDLNDFDEAALAPCTWELGRLLTSVLVGGEVLGMKRADARALCRSFLDAYTQALLKGKAQTLTQDEATGPIKRLLAELAKRKRKDFLKERTELKNNRRTLRFDGVKMRSIDAAERTLVISTFQTWAAQQPNPQFFKVLDVGQRVAGTASLGLKRYALLVEGKGSPDENYLLELKQARVSALKADRVIPQPVWANDAERIATIQRRMQGMPPALLNALSFGKDSFVLRELQPSQDRIVLQKLSGDLEHLHELIKTMGALTAWVQIRSSPFDSAQGTQETQGSTDVPGLVSFAQDLQWQGALLEHAQAYARQVEKDYQTFCNALDRGALL
jgi:uncharacterized protein (DUF2252 family)